MRFIELLRDVIDQRVSNVSNVAVLETDDYMRYPVIRKFFSAKLNNFATANKLGAPNFFVYRDWVGLFSYDPATGAIEPVSTGAPGGGPLAQTISQGQTVTSLKVALRYVYRKMEGAAGPVLFIIEGLFQKKGGAQAEEYNELSSFVRAVSSDLSMYNKLHMVVIVTDAPQAILDSGALKRSIYVKIPPSYEEERRRLVVEISEQLGVQLSSNDVERLVNATAGLNLHETESVLLLSYRETGGRLDPVTAERFKREIVRKHGLLDIETPDYGFEAVGGYETLKRYIREHVLAVLRNPERARALGIHPPRGILLFGPPGTGKTLLAKALAKELGLPFLQLRLADVVSMWYGESARRLSKALRIAESVAPAILFIDEIDQFGRRGTISEHEETRRMFGTFLEWLGNRNRRVIVVGTTNRPQDLDEAFRRVGRFDIIAPMLYPDYEARLDILRVQTSVLRRVPLAEDVDLDLVARATEYWTGAELEELVTRAARLALLEGEDKVWMRHFREALSTFVINMDERVRQMREYMALALAFTNDKRLLTVAQERAEEAREKAGTKARAGEADRYKYVTLDL